ncbi:MAG: 4Fe-4S binding protein [Deltaproteobacteria bacterium]|nr:4Fe-4S binding protein [Deltaproteobacteria bacterium]
MKDTVITTNPALCHDCYRCVRNCNVKAIRVKEGQAQIVPELCIVCGTCVRICPQKAKEVQTAKQEILAALKAGRQVIASVAPSAPACFPIQSFSQMEEALKALGFYAAEETAVGAEIVALAHREYVEQAPDQRPVITSSCPVVVNLIEQYYPDLIPHLAPIVSPMIAHGRILGKKYGPEAFIVFVGPCIAKMQESRAEALSGAIHAAMTFAELQVWLTEAGVAWDAPEGTGEKQTPGAKPAPEKARLFPLEGGLVGTARLSTDLLGERMVVASGLDACQDTLEDIRTGMLQADLVELMACKGGCINGPRSGNEEGGISLARQRILEFHSRRQPGIQLPRDQWPPLERILRDRQVPVQTFSEEQIREVLHRVNKYTPDDELNCGACGYSSCREKAVATLRGMAELTMCIPYMRRRSESLRQVVMDVAPDSILIVDNALAIQDMSPSMERLFHCKLADVVGQPLASLFIAVEDFLRVRDTGLPVIGKVRQLTENVIVEQTIVRVEKQSLLVAILRDITEREKERKKFESLREETLERTREVVGKQMRVAHEIAQLLGETTAESKMIVSHLAKLLQGEGKK